MSANRKLLALVLSIVVLPLLIVSAFFASLSVVPTYAPLIHLSLNFPPNTYTLNITSVITTNSNGTFTLYYLNGTLVQPGPPALFPTIPSSYLTFFVIALFIAAAFGLVYNLRVSKRSNLEFAPLEVEEQKEELAKILDQTIAKLREGGEYRKTVLECYALICEMLEKRSSIEGRLLTAREFKDLVSRRLELSTPYLDQVTDLFEKTRYSEGAVLRSEAEAAIACLENLSNALKEK